MQEIREVLAASGSQKREKLRTILSRQPVGGVVCTQVFTQEFCDLLLDEIKNLTARIPTAKIVRSSPLCGILQRLTHTAGLQRVLLGADRDERLYGRIHAGGATALASTTHEAPLRNIFHCTRWPQ